MATDLKDLAISYWRMERWVNYTNVERKMAANSALRTIKKYLDANGIEVLDLTGNVYDPGMAVDVINSDVSNDTDKTKIIISEMIKPIVMQNGTVIQFGQVSIGLTVKPIAENKTKEDSSKIEASDNQKDITDEIIQLSTYIKSKKNNKLKIAEITVCCLLIVFMIIGSVLLFNMNKSLQTKIENKEVVSRQIEIKNENEKEIIQTKEDIIHSNIQFAEYEIKSGDTILSICKKYNISYEDNLEYIKNINGLSDINKIYIGQKILIPVNAEEEK